MRDPSLERLERLVYLALVIAFLALIFHLWALVGGP